MTTDLLTPILDGGIRHSNFFNGRLLTAEALQAEQKAGRDEHLQLGKAIGSGVVEGLNVSIVTGDDPPVIKITKGMAVNREGQVLFLPETVDVTLLTEDDDSAGGLSLFSACKPLTDAFYDEDGFYLLAISPASSFSVETAPMQGFQGINGGTTVVNCGFRYTREGVQFKLLYIDVRNENVVGELAEILPDKMDAGTSAGVSELRNLMAHACLGTMEASGFVSDLYNHLAGGNNSPAYGVADGLRNLPTPRLFDCDVPLALIYWTSDGVEFVDNWSLRRRLTARSPQPGAGVFGARRYAEGEVAFLQFQEQIQFLMENADQSEIVAVKAVDYFRILPPVGVLPYRSEANSAGFNYEKFFEGLTTGDAVFIDGSRVGPLLQHAFRYQARDLEDHEHLWLYLIRQNHLPPGSSRQRCLLFTSGYVPYVGEAQFDLAYWDYSNYGSRTAPIDQ